MTKKFHDTFSSFDRIPACDERTNIAYHRAVKMASFDQHLALYRTRYKIKL